MARRAPTSEQSELRAADGRVPGRRGLATRQRLLNHTAALLATTSYRDLTVVDIAREAGTSPATFYQYFPDAESALVALADELVGEARERLGRPVREGAWNSNSAYATCEQVTEAFMGLWDDHRALLGVIDLASTEGDQRFREIRVQLLNPLTEAIAEVVDQQRAAGRLPADIDPVATASVLVAMLAQVSGHRYGIERYGTTGSEIQRVMARLLFTGITGRKPPT